MKGWVLYERVKRIDEVDKVRRSPCRCSFPAGKLSFQPSFLGRKGQN